MALDERQVDRLKFILAKEKQSAALAKDERQEVRSIVSHEVPSMETAKWEEVTDFAFALLGSYRLSQAIESNVRPPGHD